MKAVLFERNVLIFKNVKIIGNSLVVQWFGPHASTVGDLSSILGQGTKILHSAQCSKKKKKYEGYNLPKKRLMDKFLILRKL